MRSRTLQRLIQIRGDLVIVEDDAARKGDPILRKFAQETFVFKNEVFHWSRSALDSTVQLDDFVDRSASGYPRNVFLIRGLVREFAPMEIVAESLIEELAAHTVAVAVATNDDELFITWLLVEAF
jgi:hypothetical protein